MDNARETLDRMKLNAVALSAFAFAGITLLVATAPVTITANAATAGSATDQSGSAYYNADGTPVVPQDQAPQGAVAPQQGAPAAPPIVSAQS